MKPRFTRKLALIFVFLIAADQLSKYLVRHLGGFYVCNDGIAWGLKINPILQWIFWIVIIILLLFALYKKHFRHDTLYPPAMLCQPDSLTAVMAAGIAMRAGIILILSGAVSNMIDRLYLGCVVDFINLEFWPVFNLADAFITVGGIMLISEILKMRYKK